METDDGALRWAKPCVDTSVLDVLHPRAAMCYAHPYSTCTLFLCTTIYICTGIQHYTSNFRGSAIAGEADGLRLCYSYKSSSRTQGTFLRARFKYTEEIIFPPSPIYMGKSLLMLASMWFAVNWAIPVLLTMQPQGELLRTTSTLRVTVLSESLTQPIPIVPLCMVSLVIFPSAGCIFWPCYPYTSVYRYDTRP